MSNEQALSTPLKKAPSLTLPRSAGEGTTGQWGKQAIHEVAARKSNLQFLREKEQT
jgi:hypothetical protein